MEEKYILMCAVLW